jgi:hypothetical protein
MVCKTTPSTVGTPAKSSLSHVTFASFFMKNDVITFTDMAKRKEHNDADLLCSVDRRGYLGNLCWNIMHMVITVM